MATLNQQKIDELKRLDDDGSNETLIELIRLYQRNSPPLLKQMSDNFQKGEIDLMKRAAHSLRSSSLNLGLESLGEILRQIEYLDETSSLLDTLPDLISQAQREYTSAVQLLREAF